MSSPRPAAADGADGRVRHGPAVRRRLDAGVYHVTVSGSDGFAGIGPYVFHATVAPTAARTNIIALRDGSSLVVT